MAPAWQLRFRRHALERMAQRAITVPDVAHVIATGVAIETYPTDRPFPSRLVLGWAGPRPLHVVVADDAATGTRFVITVYEPDPTEWEPGFRRRRGR
ncbi:MAG: DUF4258 domain-containing protein [Chloroflexi bacterium]|nr:DUF4258 domain-containing protein [Chloroflexota bacterium]